MKTPTTASAEGQTHETKPAHTPTPWAFGSDRHDNHHVRIPTQDDRFGPQTAGVVFTGFSAEAEANAQLIVNAVNAYEQNQRTIAALSDALESMTRWHEQRIASLAAGEPMDTSLDGLGVVKIEVLNARAVLEMARKEAV